MAAAASQAVQAASAQKFYLPPRLLNFFARYPPEKHSAFTTGQKLPTLKQRVGMGAKPLSATTVPSSIPGEEVESAPASNETQTTAQVQTPVAEKKPLYNPFLPYKNPESGRWRGAKYGLRKQADLCKLAREYGIEELLPPSIKSAEFKQRRALEKGLMVKGTGEGQKVKGHKWERQMATTMEKRRKAMEEMPEMIRLWKQQGHGRGWKKYPK